MLWGKYAKLKILPIKNISTSLKILLFAAVFLIFLTTTVFIKMKTKMIDNGNLSDWLRGECVYLTNICFIIGFSTLYKFIGSREYEYLKSYPLKKIDDIFIAVLKIVMPNLYFVYLIYLSILNTTKFTPPEIVFLAIDSIIFVITLCFFEMIITVIIHFLKYYELIIVIILFCLYSFFKPLFYGCIKTYGAQYSIDDFIIFTGRNQHFRIINLFQEKFYLFQILNLILLLCGFLLLLYVFDITKTQDIRWIIKIKKISLLNKPKKQSPFIAFFIKDFLMLNRLISFIIMQVSYLLIYLFLFNYFTKENSIALIVLCLIFVLVSSGFSTYLFEFESKCLWLIKMMPIKNKRLFIYKLLNILIASIFLPVFIILISFIFKKVLFINMVIYLLILLGLGFVICLIYCEVLYIYFPDVKKSYPLLAFLSILIIVNPLFVFFIIPICLRFSKNKLERTEI